ncbi:MAG: prepilin-type N-terminal cleavage/methylation domain-containing protein [Solirubrobacteraceae bacterium]|nr:prepilin-type N-terminal cleavage/methylation domain-containing protein [Solirubrobacteraceae bacterium]
MSRTREAGFTLPELLIAVTLLAIVIGVLSQAVIVGLKTTAATATTLIGVADSRVLSSHLQTDVKQADTLGTTGGPPCSSTAPELASATRVLWTLGDVSQDGTRVVAAYFVVRVPADPGEGTSARSELRRLACSLDGDGAATPTESPGIVVASWPGLADDPVIACDDRPRPPGGRTVLAEAIAADATIVEVAGSIRLPESGPYTLFVGDEPMEVTAGFGTDELTVTRTTPEVGHAGGTPVTWGPLLAAASDESETTLTIANPGGLPAADEPYTIFVGGEQMEVAAGSGGGTLDVERSSAPAAHPAGTPISLGPVVLGALGETDTTLTVSDASSLPAPEPTYRIDVGGEAMTVTAVDAATNEVTVEERPAGVAHPLGAPLTHTQCGASADRFASPAVALLLEQIDETETVLAVDDVSGLPASPPPYRIFVEDEPMTVDSVEDNELTVTRGTPPAEHPAGAAVVWRPRMLRTPLAAAGTLVSLADATGLPSSGPSYRVSIGDESLRVTGGFGTLDLQVSRSSGAAHLAGTPVEWVPGSIAVRVPASGAVGSKPYGLLVTRRST